MNTSILQTIIMACLTSEINCQLFTWRDSYSRGTSSASYCVNPTPIKEANQMCYPPCNTLYTALMSDDRCYEPCPYLYTDAGLTCNDNGAYWRPAGTFTQGSCTSTGNSHYNPALGCHVAWTMWYITCQTGYYETFASVCQCFPSATPYTKVFYSRTPQAQPTLCNPLEKDPNDLQCYPYCMPGYIGDKDICWKACPSATPYPCGKSLCTDTAATCTSLTAQETLVSTAVVIASASGANNFIMEDILRAQTGTALGTAASLDGALTFATIDAQRALPRLCLTRRFPQFLGSSAGLTTFDTIQIDSLGNIGVGGSSTDMTLVSTAGNLLIGLFQKSGYNYTWMNQLTPAAAGQKVTQILFKSDNTKLIALIASVSPFQIVVINTLDGIIHSKVKDNGYLSPLGGAITLDPVTNYIYLAGTTPAAYRLAVIALDILNNPASLGPYTTIQLGLYNYVPYSIEMSKTLNTLYVAGSCQDLSCISLVSSQVSYTPTNVLNGFTTASISQMSQYNNPKLSVWSDSVLFYVAQGSLSTNYAIILWRKGISPVSTEEGYVYTEGNPDLLSIFSMDSTSASEMYVGFKNAARSKTGILQVQFTTPGTSASIKNYLFQKPMLTLNQVTFLKVQSSGTFFFGGGISSISSTTTGSCLNLGTGQIGYLATSDATQSCLMFTFNSGTFGTYTKDVAIVFSSVGGGQTTSGVTFIGGNAVSMVAQSKLYVTLDTCCNVPVVSSSMPYHKYIIDYPMSTYDHPVFMQTPYQCTDISSFQFCYKRDIVLSPSTTQINTSPYIFFRDKVDFPQFNVTTSMPTLAGVYKVQLTGTLPNHQTFTGAISQIELWNIPSTEFITSYRIADMTYIATDVPLNYTAQYFRASNLSDQFYILYYLEMYIESNATWTRYLNPNLFQFVQEGKTPNMMFYTKENSLKGAYKMRLKGKFTPNTAFEGVSYFTLTVLDHCYLTKIVVASNLPSLIQYTMSSPIADPVIKIFDPWYDTLGKCGRIEYKATSLDGSPIPSFIQFNPNIRQFTISQSAGMYVGNYPVRLQGKLTDFFMTNVQFMNVSVRCNVRNVKSAQKDFTIDYIAGTPEMHLQIYEFEQQPMCESGVRYEANMLSGAPLPKEYLRFDELDNSLGLGYRQIHFKTPKDVKIKEFEVVVRGIIDEDRDIGQLRTYGQLKITFRVTVSEKFVQTEYPSLYLTVQAGEEWKVPFVVKSSRRMLFDSLPLNVTLKKQVVTYVSGALTGNSVQLVPTTQPPTFYDETQGTLTIAPQSNTNEGTRYVIQTIVEDGGATQFRVLQDMFVLVYKNLANIDIDAEQRMMRGLLIQTMQEFGSIEPKPQPKKSLWEGKGLSVQIFGDTTLKAKIHKVNETGSVILKFSKPIMKVENITLIDTTVLNISVISSYLQGDIRNLNITSWQTIFMSEKELRLQVNFQSPLTISAYELMDTLRIRVIDNAFFLTEQKQNKTYAPISANYQMFKLLPRQINSQDSSLINGGKLFAKGIMGALFGTAFMSIPLASSMSALWGMINVSQMLMVIPLMNINLPANVNVIFQQLQQLISFDFFETSQVPCYNSVFSFPDEDSENSDSFEEASEIPSQHDVKFSYGVRFKFYGYEYFNMIQNMGSGFVMFFVTIVYQALIYIAHRASQILRFNLKKLNNLQKEAFFNLSIKTLQEGCLEFLICATINILNYDFKTTGTERFSTLFAIGIVISIALLIVYSLYINVKIDKTGQEPSYKERINAIYEGSRIYGGFNRLNYQVYGMIRRVYLVVVLIKLKNEGISQIIAYMAQAYVYTMYLYLYRPLEDSKQMKIELFNESMILFVSQTLFAFTDYSGEQVLSPLAKYQFGWYLCGLMLFTVGVNILIALFDQIMELIALIKVAYRKIRAKCCKKNKTVEIKPLNDSEINIPELNSDLNNSMMQSHKNFKITRQAFIDMFEIKKPVRQLPLYATSEDSIIYSGQYGLSRAPGVDDM